MYGPNLFLVSDEYLFDISIILRENTPVTSIYHYTYVYWALAICHIVNLSVAPRTCRKYLIIYKIFSSKMFSARIYESCITINYKL